MTISIFDVADIIDKDIKVHYYANQDGRWCASFETAEIKGNGVLVSASGNGKSPLDAVAAYAKEIAGKRMVFNATVPEYRMEFTMPKDLGI